MYYKLDIKILWSWNTSIPIIKCPINALIPVYFLDTCVSRAHGSNNVKLTCMIVGNSGKVGSSAVKVSESRNEEVKVVRLWLVVLGVWWAVSACTCTTTDRESRVHHMYECTDKCTKMGCKNILESISGCSANIGNCRNVNSIPCLRGKASVYIHIDTCCYPNSYHSDMDKFACIDTDMIECSTAVHRDRYGMGSNTYIDCYPNIARMDSLHDWNIRMSMCSG